MLKKNFTIQWEDEDDSPKPAENKIDQNDEFSALLQQNPLKNHQDEYEVGQKVDTIIISTDSPHNVLVELDPQTTGVVEKAQLIDDSTGELTYQSGDRVTLYIIKTHDGDLQLSPSLDKSLQAIEDLQTAFDNQLPVKGKVVKENKAGFEVSIFGKTAFCPVSQMDTRYIDNKSLFIDQEFEFVLTKFDASGKNIVISRAKLLNRIAQDRVKELQSQLDSDIILTGKVREIREFGAFIDIGGVDGLLPLGELGYGRNINIHDLLDVNDEVRVKVLDISNKDGKHRITLSLKSLETDPWMVFTDNFSENETYSGKVTKVEKFGAFVELTPGIEGLVHISEMSWEKRILHPNEVLSTGDQVKVRILSYNLENKKISLSLREIEEDPWHQLSDRLESNQTYSGKVQKLKSFGALIELLPGVVGLLPMGTMKQVFGETYRKHCSPPKAIDVTISRIDEEERKISLSLPALAKDDEKWDRQPTREWAESEQIPMKQTQKMTAFGKLLADKLEQENQKNKKG